MQQQPSTTAHSATGLNSTGIQPEIIPSAPWSVTALTTLADYRLKVTFNDGLSGIADMSALIKSERAGVFARLLDPEIFAEARIEYGAIIWPEHNGQPALDIAPDAMYRAIMETGQWKL